MPAGASWIDIEEDGPVEWVGSSKSDQKAFPEAVRRVVGYAPYQAQVGLRHRDVKPLRGLGSNVLEAVSRFDGDTFRAVYRVRFRSAVYVLHAFQKKAKLPSNDGLMFQRQVRDGQVMG